MTDRRTVANGRYVLGTLLGRGGMAQVHQGLDLRLDRPVAVKQLSAHLAADPTAQTRFRREAQAAASLNHPAIASVFDTGEETDPVTGTVTPYIVMELVEGSTLRQVLNDSGPLPPARALLLAQGVLDALGHSHAAGIIHRDIKPANVMLTAAGAVKVMDFGIARAVDDTSMSLTQTATVIGTAQYLSPEQAAGRSVDLRSDLYSVGCLLFELLVGRPPFVGENSISIAYQQVREEPVPPSQLDPRMPPAVDAVVLKALAKDPDQRYQSAPEMKAALGRLLSDLDTSAVPPAAVPAAGLVAAADAAPEEPRRSPAARALVIALSVFVLLGLGAFGLYRALAPSGASTAAVRVPDVVGRTREEADTRLRNIDLVPRFTDVNGRAGTTVDTVVEQDPAAGRRLATGTVVTLRINVGPANVTIPDNLVGRTLAAAKKRLKAAGFSRVREEEVQDPSGVAEAGTVLSVDPAEGRSAATNATVVLRFASDSTGTGQASQTAGGARRTSTPQPSRSTAPTQTTAPPATASTRTTTQPTASSSPTRKPTVKPSPTAKPTSARTPKVKKSKPPKGGSPPKQKADDPTRPDGG